MSDHTPDILVRLDTQPDGRRIAHVTIHNPRRANSLNSALMERFVERLEALAGDPALHALVLTGVDHRMTLMREESFGPVIGIQSVSGDEEALALMNDTRYGLTAGVYTRDEPAARAILSRVAAGSVYWNCCDRVSPRLPWSGVGDSGIGLTLSTYGIQTFTRPKAWHLRQPG